MNPDLAVIQQVNDLTNKSAAFKAYGHICKASHKDQTRLHVLPSPPGDIKDLCTHHRIFLDQQRSRRLIKMEMKGDHVKCKYLSFKIIEHEGFFQEFNTACKCLGDIILPTVEKLKKYRYSFFN